MADYLLRKANRLFASDPTPTNFARVIYYTIASGGGIEIRDILPYWNTIPIQELLAQVVVPQYQVTLNSIDISAYIPAIKACIQPELNFLLSDHGLAPVGSNFEIAYLGLQPTLDGGYQICALTTDMNGFDFWETTLQEGSAAACQWVEGGDAWEQFSSLKKAEVLPLALEFFLSQFNEMEPYR
jgi:hypothetical protein